MIKNFNLVNFRENLRPKTFWSYLFVCNLDQESRTLDMNNVQDGTWHGRGDTICIGGYSEGSKASFQLHPPPVVSTNSVDPCTVQISINVGDHSWDSEVGHCTEPLVTQS